MWRQDVAGLHVGNVAAAFFVEPNQHATFLDDLMHRQASPVAITPGISLYRRQKSFWTNATNMPETILQNALLGCQLSGGIHVLHCTTATDAEMGTARFKACI